MPMIRKPNLSDLSVDISMEKLYVTVGNEQRHHEVARRIPLSTYIEQLGIYNSRSYNSASEDLLLQRDDMVLASAQICLLPLAKGSAAVQPEVEFVPQLYSYQSEHSKPAVLAIISTTQGTSAQIIHHDDQPLYFNRGGISTKFVAKNLPQVLNILHKSACV